MVAGGMLPEAAVVGSLRRRNRQFHGLIAAFSDTNRPAEIFMQSDEVRIEPGARLDLIPYEEFVIAGSDVFQLEFAGSIGESCLEQVGSSAARNIGNKRDRD